MPDITSMSAPIRPFVATLPECGNITPAMILSRVDLPEPLTPTIASDSPGATSKSMSLSTHRHGLTLSRPSRAARARWSRRSRRPRSAPEALPDVVGLDRPLS